MHRLKKFIIGKSWNGSLEVNHIYIRLNRKDQLFLIYREYEWHDYRFNTFDTQDYNWLSKKEIEKLDIMYKKAEYNLPEVWKIYEINIV